jgi:hypothetical protein
VTASFHLPHHLVVCVRSFLPHRPVFSPLVVGRSVAPAQQMGSYARVVDAKALPVGGMCGIVGWREAKAVMRLYQRFPLRQQGGAFRSGRSVVAAALLLRGHSTPPFLCPPGEVHPRRARLSRSAVPISSTGALAQCPAEGGCLLCAAQGPQCAGACPTSAGAPRASAATYSRVTPCPLTRAANGVRSCGCLRIGCPTLHH